MKDEKGSKKYFWKNKSLLLFFIILSLVLFTILIHRPSLQLAMDTHVEGNDFRFETAAFNMVKYGIFYGNTDVRLAIANQESYRGYTYREPGYSAYLAMIYFFIPEFKEATIDMLKDGQHHTGRQIRRKVQWANIGFMIIIMLIFFFIADYFFKNKFYAFFSTLLLIILMPIEIQDLIAAFLLLLHSFLIYLAVSKGKNYAWLAIASGILLGLLILTKAVFQFWLVLCFFLPFILLIFIRKKQEFFHYLKVFMLISLFGLITIFPWLMRNYIQTGKMIISKRAGRILAIRAEYSLMNWQEYWGAFIYFLPRSVEPIHEIRRYCMTHYVPSPYGYLRFTRKKDQTPLGFYKSVQMKRGVVNQQAELFVKESKNKLTYDKALKKAAYSILQKNWFKHLMLCLPFALRGSFYGDAYDYIYANKLIGKIMRFIPVFFIPFFLLIVFLMLFKFNLPALLFLFPSLYCFAIHAFITHFLPRFSNPCLFIFILCVFFIIQKIIEHWQRKVKITSS